MRDVVTAAGAVPRGRNADAARAAAPGEVGGGQTPRRRVNDLMIAATALAHGMTLVTKDRGLTTAVDGLVPVQSLF